MDISDSQSVKTNKHGETEAAHRMFEDSTSMHVVTDKTGNKTEIQHVAPDKDFVNVYRDIQAKPEDVWKTVGKYGDMSWHPGVQSVEIETKNGETVRTLHAKDSVGTLPEKLLSQGPDSYTYSVINNSHDGLNRPETTFKVEPDGQGGTRLTWSVVVEGPDSKQVEGVSKNVLSFLTTGLDAVQASFDHNSPIAARFEDSKREQIKNHMVADSDQSLPKLELMGDGSHNAMKHTNAK